MLEKNVMIVNKVGLHARPCAVLVKTANDFPCTVELLKADKAYNAKSILTIMSAGIQQNDTVTVRTNGEQEAEALESIIELIQSGFGEN